MRKVFSPNTKYFLREMKSPNFLLFPLQITHSPNFTFDFQCAQQDLMKRYFWFILLLFRSAYSFFFPKNQLVKNKKKNGCTLFFEYIYNKEDERLLQCYCILSSSMESLLKILHFLAL